LIRRLLLLERLDLTPAELDRKLEAVQIDPVNLLARNHELVIHNRLRDRRAGQAVYFSTEGLFEYVAGNRALIPMPDLPIFVPFMRRREKELEKYLLQPRGPAVRVLREMEKRGPLTSRSIDCGKKISGYWDANGVRKTKETTQALRLLWEAGRVTVIGRQGLENVYDLAERALPSGLLRKGERIDLPEAARLLREKFYRAFQVFDAQASFFGWQRMSAADRMRAVEEDRARGLIEPLWVEGVRRMYWALAGTGDALAEIR
jgi:hypothetical protein